MDQEDKKRALRMLTCGLYVVAARDGNDVAAGTVTWLSQASFSPPLLMVAIKGDSHLHAMVERSRAFGVSVVSTAQKDLASAFFRPSKVEDGKMNGYPIQYGPETGSPVVSQCPAWVEARVTGSVSGGDHTVYVAEVVGAGLNDPAAKALVLSDTEWTYGG